MYINFWYAMELAGNVTDKPVKLQVLGQPFVVFRDSKGQAHTLSNVCSHRGGSLAGGKVRGDRIECPYHGWQFGGDGVCAKIPSLGQAGNKTDPGCKIPPRTKIDAYPTVERYGIVFAFLGDLPETERPAILEIPEYDQPGWLANQLSYEFNANYERMVENTLDPAHNEYVHPTHGYEGNRAEYAVPELKPIEAELGFGFMTKFMAPELKDPTMAKARPAAGEMEAGAGHWGPHHTWTFIHMTETNWMHQWSFETPIDETRTRVFLVNMRNMLLDRAHDASINERNMVIAGQDKVVLEDLQPALTPDDMTHENMMPSDKCVVLYRQWLKRWDAKGWRIDSRAVAQAQGRVAYAIPSPARRTSKGWAMDAIPLVAGKVDAKAAAE